MPYQSHAQAAYFNIHRKQMEARGVDVAEWNRASRGRKLPRHVAMMEEHQRRLRRKRLVHLM